MSGQIFISYRREESRWSARSLNDRLCRDFERKQIFMDLDAIALGEDFVEAIETTVAKCDVLIAVIGNNWLTSKDERGGRRLDNPEDFVRMEIGTALKRKIRVIPVLVDGAVMPSSTELPEDLKLLVRRNALRITDTSFDGDCQRLVGAIKLVLEKAAAEEQERLAAEQGQREEAEARERAEKERLEAEQLEKERLKAVLREKDRLEAEIRERDEQQRVAAEKRQREQEAPRGQSVKRGQKRETREQPQSKQRLSLVDKYSWVLFALSILAWLCLPSQGQFDITQAYGWPLFLLFVALSALLAVSSFFKYRFRRILEGSISAVFVVWNLFILWRMFDFFPRHSFIPPGIGAFLGVALALFGAVAKIYVLIRRRDLDAT
jgi:TIR domain-containing protein